MSRRRLFTFLSSLSLVLSGATCVLWVWSYSVGVAAICDRSDETPGKDVASVTSSRGVVSFRRDTHPTAEDPPGFRWHVDEAWPLRETPGWRTFALVQKEDAAFGGRSWAAYVPHWLVAGLLVVPAVSTVRRWRRDRRRAHHNLCLGCGYDLRTTPERCPECGTVPFTPARSV